MDSPFHVPTTGDNRDLFAMAEDALTKVVLQINDTQWDMTMPDDFRSFGDKPLTLRKVINYHLYDDIWIPDTLAGKTIAEVGNKYDGDLLGDDPKARFKQVTDTSKPAVSAADPVTTVHLTYGDYPTHEFLLHISCFRAFRAVELARIIGVSDRLPDTLVEMLHARLVPRLDDFRAIGIFQPAQPVPAGADRQAELLAMCGYKPQ